MLSSNLSTAEKKFLSWVAWLPVVQQDGDSAETIAFPVSILLNNLVEHFCSLYRMRN